MALTRKMLGAMGIEDDKIDQIIETHVTTVNEIKDERDRYKKDADELAETKQRLAELEKNDDSDDLREKYQSLEKEFSDYKAQVENERAKNQREGLYKELLKEAGIDEKRIGTILKVTNLDELEITKDGALKGAENLKTKIAEEWSDFIVQTETRKAGVDTPPPGSGGTGKTKDEILAIKDKGERQAAIAENHELFGF